MMVADQLSFADVTEARAYKNSVLDAVLCDTRALPHIQAVAEIVNEHIDYGQVFSLNDVREHVPTWVRPQLLGPAMRYLCGHGAIRRVPGEAVSTKRNTHGKSLFQYVVVSPS